MFFLFSSYIIIHYQDFITILSYHFFPENFILHLESISMASLSPKLLARRKSVKASLPREIKAGEY